MIHWRIIHIRPDGTRLELATIQASSASRARRQFEREHRTAALHFRPFSVLPTMPLIYKPRP